MSTEKTKTSKPHRAWASLHDCAVCGSKAIGINFAVPTCAPCKAFFRRNARRHEVLQMACQIWDGDLSTNENNKEQCDINSQKCSQLRRCTSCRLRRCFNVGMKEELVRTDEEKLRYKLLIENNRQRRREISHFRQNSQKISKILTTDFKLLEEEDWKLLSNIVSAYDNHCLKIFAENRRMLFEEEMKHPNRAISKIDHHVKIRVNNIKAYISFLSSLPVIRSLSRDNRSYLCKHNIRSLIFLNYYELDQACFSEPWQSNVDDEAAEAVYGETLFADRQLVKSRVTSILINDPAVTRLWLLILFFSTPLHCHYDLSLPEITKKNRLDLSHLQDSFTMLLWNYLVHRHGMIDAVRIFSNLIRVYLQMQQFSRSVNHLARTRSDLHVMNEAFNQAVVFEMDI